MKPYTVGSVLVIVMLTWLFPHVIVRAEPRTTQSTSSDSAKGAQTPPVVVVYKPPLRGAPGGRVSGGTRGNQTYSLSVLAPNHTGLTSQDQPVLYWYVSKALSSPIELTIVDSGATPIIEKVLAPSTKSGIQRLPLTELGVHLEVGKQYHWFLAIVPNPKQRSEDVLAGATIERLALPENPSTHIPGSEWLSAARLYAEAGYWYDAIALISEQIELNPLDPNPRAQRVALLQQVGLQEIADYDKSWRAN